MKLHMMIGSDSDEKKIAPGLEQFTKDYDVEVEVQYASADNTEQKVHRFARQWYGDPKHDGCKVNRRGPLPIISGAGMSNVLTGVLKGYAKVDDLVIGIPITDSKTDGLASIFSTDEKPPRNPVLATPLNGTYAAANIAMRFLSDQKYDRVVLPSEADVQYSGKVQKELERLGLPFAEVDTEKIGRDDLVVTPFFQRDSEVYDSLISTIDARLAAGLGIQIATRDDSMFADGDFADYISIFKGNLKATGYTTAGWPINAAIVAAQIMRHDKALQTIVQEKLKKSEKLDGHRGLIVKNGSFREIGGK